MSNEIFGLKTCDTCRKARKALDEAGVDYAYTDVRTDGVSTKDLTNWVSALGWEKVLNKSSTTWRGLDEADKEGLDDKKAVALMADHPTLIKRPVIVRDGMDVTVGWSKEVQERLLKGD
ncbi:MAG: Spx/MgsR family RNA polymerase-binding regulatory protein [Pseudomonadota bacterium]